jgi:C4-dicarboxylate transporter DctQ subunit
MKLEKLTNSIPIFGGALLAVIVTLTFLQIVLRQIFSFSLSWSDEVSQFCMTWLALIGSIWLTKCDRHLNTGLKLHQKLHKWQLRLVDSILALVIAIITLVVAYQSAIFALQQVTMEATSLPWIKMGYIFIALPLAMLAACYYYLKSFFKNIWLILKKD